MLSSKAQAGWLFIFMIILFDSMSSYLVRNWIGINIPVNAIIPFMIFVAIIIWGIGPVVPPLVISFALFLLVFSLFCGALLIRGEPTYARLLALASATSAFIVGFTVGMNTEETERFVNILLIVSLTYVIVCLFALSQIAPDVFPIINSYGYHHGKLFVRPEVTIDQNFQIFYLFPIASLYFLSGKPYRFWLILGGCLGAVLVLVMIETRSGILLFIGCFSLSVFASFLVGKNKYHQLIFALIVFVIFCLIGGNWALEQSRGLIVRFKDPEYQKTIYGRIYAMEFLFRKLVDIKYWIPQGYKEYLSITKNIPHFNPTAIYLQGGLLGLISWVILVPFPLIRLLVLFVQKRLDDLETIILISGVVVLFAQLSLNTPFYEQVWLWAGAVIGAHRRALIRTTRSLESG